jgi:FkbM family methyltransferase
MELENVYDSYNEFYLNELSKKLNENKGIVIFGAGILGNKIATFLSNKNHNIICFADNNSNLWGSYINGIPVLSLVESGEKYSNSICIICIWNPRFHYEIIKKQLDQFKFEHIIHSAQIMQLYSEELLPHYHFANPNFYIQNKDQIFKTYELLSDAESKRQYILQLEYRFKIDFNSLPKSDSHNQYFPNGIINLSENEVFLDAGAYDGDTFLEFYKRVNGKYINYIALEPDPKNFEVIQLNLESYNNVVIDPFAVGERHEFLNFNSTGGEGASISNEGDVSVECVSIDEKYIKYKPTFLKFDIEGAELDALKGAQNVIQQFTPTIAVCIYHKPQDIFEIPLWINDLNPNYNFFVRTHGHDGFEFVLYAVSKK